MRLTLWKKLPSVEIITNTNEQTENEQQYTLLLTWNFCDPDLNSIYLFMCPDLPDNTVQLFA